MNIKLSIFWITWFIVFLAYSLMLAQDKKDDVLNETPFRDTYEVGEILDLKIQEKYQTLHADRIEYSFYQVDEHESHFQITSYDDPMLPVMINHRNEVVAIRHGIVRIIVTYYRRDSVIDAYDHGLYFIKPNLHIGAWVELNQSNFKDAITENPNGQFILTEDVYIHDFITLPVFSGAIINPDGYQLFSGSIHYGLGFPLFKTIKHAYLNQLIIRAQHVDVDETSINEYGLIAEKGYGSILANIEIYSNIDTHDTDITYIGGLIGYAHTCQWEGITFEGNITTHADYAGGLFGVSLGMMSIDDDVSTANYRGDHDSVLAVLVHGIIQNNHSTGAYQTGAVGGKNDSHGVRYVILDGHIQSNNQFLYPSIVSGYQTFLGAEEGYYTESIDAEDEMFNRAYYGMNHVTIDELISGMLELDYFQQQIALHPKPFSWRFSS